MLSDKTLSVCAILKKIILAVLCIAASLLKQFSGC